MNLSKKQAGYIKEIIEDLDLHTGDIQKDIDNALDVASKTIKYYKKSINKYIKNKYLNMNKKYKIIRRFFRDFKNTKGTAKEILKEKSFLFKYSYKDLVDVNDVFSSCKLSNFLTKLTKIFPDSIEVIGNAGNYKKFHIKELNEKKSYEQFIFFVEGKKIEGN